MPKKQERLNRYIIFYRVFCFPNPFAAHKLNFVVCWFYFISVLKRNFRKLSKSGIARPSFLIQNWRVISAKAQECCDNFECCITRGPSSKYNRLVSGFYSIFPATRIFEGGKYLFRHSA